MTEANKFLDRLKDGYDEVKLHEMISVPKIRLQGIMQEYAEYYYKTKVERVTDEMIEEYAESVDRLCAHTLGIRQGAKWFKEQLLNK